MPVREPGHYDSEFNYQTSDARAVPLRGGLRQNLAGAASSVAAGAAPFFGEAEPSMSPDGQPPGPSLRFQS